MAQAQNDSVVCAEAKYRVSYNGLKPLVKKQYLDLDYEETSGTYFAIWGIEVDSQGQTLELLTLHDTYGAALLLPQSADGTVDFDQMDMQIVYADPGGVPDPTIPIEEKDVHMDANNRTIDIDLAPYFAQMAGLPKQSFRVTYKLQVDKSALEQGSTPESFRNQVFGEFKTTEMTDLANSAISTAELPVKTENTLILQTGGQYNSATRALPWTTTINPGLQSGVVSPNLTSVVYEDRFTKGSSSSEFFGYEYQSFGLTEAAIQAQRDSIEQQIKAQFQEKGLTAATVNVSITETDTERVLRVELTNTGTASIQFRYSTYVLKPEHWASNLSNRTFRNQVSLLSAGTAINGVAITKDATASARVTVSGTVLQKWPRDSYDTTNNQLDWGIEVNRRLSPLGKIQVVDVLPEGVTNAPLSGAELVLSRDEAGTDIIRSLETDAAGTVQFEDLLPGHTYYVMERRAPAGYEKTDRVFPVTIPTVSSGGTPEPVQLSVPNQRSRDDSGSGGGGSGGGGNVTPLQYTLTYDLRYDSKTERETYPAGTHVRLNRTPFRDGYFFTGWYREAACINRISEVYLTGNQTVYAGWERYAVSDLLNAEDHFAYIIGYPDGKVHPEDNVTRGEVATIFFRLLDPEVREDNLTQDTAFTDVPADRWYRTAIATMESMGIVNGRTPTEFAPDAPITRAEFAAIASRFHLGELTPDAAFTDIAGHWAEDEICRGATLGWIRGYEDGSFRPEQYITRAETMTLVNRMLLRLPETPADLLSNMIRWPDNADSQVWYYLAVQEATNSHDHLRKPDGVYETWTALNPVEDWTKYER